MAGWLATALVVASYDTWALRTGHPTMSAAYHHDSPARWPILAATIMIVAHLQHQPRQLARFDPLTLLAHRIQPRSTL